MKTLLLMLSFTLLLSCSTTHEGASRGLASDTSFEDVKEALAAKNLSSPDTIKLIRKARSHYANDALIAVINDTTFNLSAEYNIAASITNPHGRDVFIEILMNKEFRHFQLLKLAASVDNPYAAEAFIQVSQNPNFRSFDLVKIVTRIDNQESLNRFMTAYREGFASINSLEVLIDSQTSLDDVKKVFETKGIALPELLRIAKGAKSNYAHDAFIALAMHETLQYTPTYKLAAQIRSAHARDAFLEILGNADFNNYQLLRLATTIDNSFAAEAFIEVVRNKEFRSFDLLKVVAQIKTQDTLFAFQNSYRSGYSSIPALEKIVALDRPATCKSLIKDLLRI